MLFREFPAAFCDTMQLSGVAREKEFNHSDLLLNFQLQNLLLYTTSLFAKATDFDLNRRISGNWEHSGSSKRETLMANAFPPVDYIVELYRSLKGEASKSKVIRNETRPFKARARRV